MNEAVVDILREAMSRRITDEETAKLRALVPGEERRFDIAEALQKNETRIANDGVKKFLDQYPDFVNKHDSARAKCLRDKTFYVRSLASAIILGDVELLEQEMKVYYVADLAQVKITPTEVADSFAHIGEAVQKYLAADHASEVMRFINYTIDVMHVAVASANIPATDPRRQAAFHLRKKEAACAEYAVNHLFEKHPNFEATHGPTTRDKGMRDGKIMLRHIGHAIVTDNNGRFAEAVRDTFLKPLAASKIPVSTSEFKDMVGFLGDAVEQEIPTFADMIRPLFQEALKLCEAA